MGTLLVTDITAGRMDKPGMHSPKVTVAKRRPKKFCPVGLGRLRQEGHPKFKASVDYITRPCLKKPKEESLSPALTLGVEKLPPPPLLPGLGCSGLPRASTRRRSSPPPGQLFCVSAGGEGTRRCQAGGRALCEPPENLGRPGKGAAGLRSLSCACLARLALLGCSGKGPSCQGP